LVSDNVWEIVFDNGKTAFFYIVENLVWNTVAISRYIISDGPIAGKPATNQETIEQKKETNRCDNGHCMHLNYDGPFNYEYVNDGPKFVGLPPPQDLEQPKEPVVGECSIMYNKRNGVVDLWVARMKDFYSDACLKYLGGQQPDLAIVVDTLGLRELIAHKDVKFAETLYKKNEDQFYEETAKILYLGKQN
jgi:hypothetical protein